MADHDVFELQLRVQKEISRETENSELLGTKNSHNDKSLSHVTCQRLPTGLQD